jgi:RNA polymerase sigma-70 factor (ECF subfamily)
MLSEELQKARNGDTGALNNLLEKHKDLAFSIAKKYVKNETAAEDIVQEAFIKVFLNIHNFKNEATFSTWLYKIVYHEALKQLNKTKKLVTIRQEVASENNYSEMKVFDHERYDIFKTAMQCLSVNEYLVINLFYLAEKDIREIVKITNQSNANIKVLLYRARKKMADYFDNNEALKNSL